jgi:hypothetical protein
MTVRNWAIFRSDLADEGVKNGDDFLAWPGRIHVLVAAEILQALGWEVLGLVDMQRLGWDLAARLGGKEIWLRAASPGGVILVIEDANPERTWYFGRKPSGQVFRDLLSGLHAALHADGRFHDIRWFTRKEIDCVAPGAATPVSDVEEMAGLPPRPWREWDHTWRDR